MVFLVFPGGSKDSSSYIFECNCPRTDCRLSQYITKNIKSKTPLNKEVKPNPPSSVPSYNYSTFPSDYSINVSSSNVLSDNNSSKDGTAACRKIIQKNNLDLTLDKHEEPGCRDYINQKTQHHTTSQTCVETSTQVIPKRHAQYHIRNKQTQVHEPEYPNRKRVHEYVSCYPIPDLPNPCPMELQRAHQDIIRRAGGIKRVNRVYDELVFLSRCLGGLRPLLENSPKEGNTLLMWLCCQPHNQDNMSCTKVRGITLDGNRFLYSKIVAVAMAMISEAYENNTKDAKDKCLLFARNCEEANALELASLTNKSIVACWLAMLYPLFGRDVNETNNLGHSVLHLLARKGDETADMLQELLKLRNDSNSSSLVSFGRIFRLDVVNSGAKTPLDVAVACESISRNEQISDTRYQKVISHFHETIAEEAEEFEKRMELERQRKGKVNSK